MWWWWWGGISVPSPGSLGSHGAHACLFRPFLPSPLAGLWLVLSCSKYPVSCFTSSGRDPTVKVPFRVSFPAGCSVMDKPSGGGQGSLERWAGPRVDSSVSSHSGPCSCPPVVLAGAGRGWWPAAWPKPFLAQGARLAEARLSVC